MFLRLVTIFLAVLANSHGKPYSRDDTHDPIQMKITYYHNKVMTVAFGVGTPVQTLNLVLDSTSADIVVFDAKCVKDDKTPCAEDGSYTRKSFNLSSSSTYKDLNVSLVRWDHRDLKFEMFRDVTTFGGFITKNTSLGIAYEIGTDYNWMTADGIIGLGLFGMMGRSIVPNITSSHLNSSIATIWLNDFSVPSASGVLTLGGVDDVNCDVDDMVTVNTISRYAWNFILTSAGIGNYAHQKNMVANVDTTNRFTLVPNVILGNIVRTINATYDSKIGSWFVPCLGASVLPPITFSIGKHVFIIKYVEYVESVLFCVACLLFQYQSSTNCELLFKVNHDWENNHYGAEVILGHSFIRSYCTVFDFDRQTLGFTLANHLM